MIKERGGSISISLVRFQVVKVHLDYIKRKYNNYNYQKLYKILNISSDKELDGKKYITAIQHAEICKEIYNFHDCKVDEYNDWYNSGREFYKTQYTNTIIDYMLRNLKINQLLNLFVKIACQYNKNYIYNCKKEDGGGWLFSIKFNPTIESEVQININKELLKLTAINTCGYLHGIADLKKVREFSATEVKIDENLSSASFGVKIKVTDKVNKKMILFGILCALLSINYMTMNSIWFYVILNVSTMLICFALYSKKQKELINIIQDGASEKILSDEEFFNRSVDSNLLKSNEKSIKLLKKISNEKFIITKKNLEKLKNYIKEIYMFKSIEFFDVGKSSSESYLNSLDFVDDYEVLERKEMVKIIDSNLLGQKNYVFKITKELFLFVSDYRKLGSYTLQFFIVFTYFLRFSIDSIDRERLRIKLKNQDENLNLAIAISHDLRSPLMALDYLIESAKLEKKENNILKMAVNRIESMTIQLLNFKKENPTSSLKSFNAVVAMRDYLEEISLLPIFKKIKFITNERCINIYGSKVNFVRAMANFICNADEATEVNGSIEVIFEKKEKIIIRVIDNGTGLKEHQLVELNESNKITTTKLKGNGQGISSSIRLLSKMGFKVNYKKKSIGTCIEVIKS